MPLKINRKQLFLWLTLGAILILCFSIRVVGINRSRSVDYHPDEWVLARPIHQIANQGQVGLKIHYKWPGCGIIYPVGYTLHFLKPASGEYSYESILRILRVLSAMASVGAVLVVFLFLRHYHSTRAGFIGAGLLGVSKFPVIVGHYATLDSVTLLIVISVLFGAFRFFKITEKEHQNSTVKPFLLGLLIGWGIAVKWTLLLCAIPLFVAFTGSLISAVQKHQTTAFLNFSIRQCLPLALGLILGFLVFFPDIQLVPDKVKEGLDFEIKHHQTGHYGAILSGTGQLSKRITRTYRNFVGCGWQALAMSGLCSLVFVFFKRTPLKWFLFFTFLLWTYVPFKNLISPPRHYLVPYLLMMMMLALFIDFLLGHQKRAVRLPAYVLTVFIISISLLYTCICISPFWQKDPRVACAEWIMKNVPEGSGVTWAPRHNIYDWAVPGTRIAPSLFKQFPRQAKPGKDQYFIVSPNVKRVFKKHPPTRKIIPSEWFPAKPPTQMEILFFYEINQGGGPHIEHVKNFYATPRFLGLTLKLFHENIHANPTFACKNVEVFKLKKNTASQNSP